MAFFTTRSIARIASQGQILKPAIATLSSKTVIRRGRALHNSPATQYAKPKAPDPKENPTHTLSKPHREENFGRKQFADFALAGRVFIVTGGAQGLGLALAEGLVEAGGKVYCLDRAEKPDEGWQRAQERVVPEWGGRLLYRQQDVTEADHLDQTIASIAHENGGIDGAIAAAGVQKITPALEYSAADIAKMMAINYSGVFLTASSVARQMFEYKRHGSICLIASASGLEATKGLMSPVYNSSKAAVIQLARSLAMEWSPVRKDGSGGIRVNALSPGHIITPMVRKNMEEVPGLREDWEAATMMGRLAETHEFKGAALYLMSNASSFVTGSNMVVDGGHSSW